MNEFNCPEPGCMFHIGIAGERVTHEDFEAQDYYDQEIEEHQQMHSEHVIEVRVRDLTFEHVGMQIKLFGRWEDLHGYSHQGILGYEESKLHVGLLRKAPERLFVGAKLDQSVMLRKPPALTSVPGEEVSSGTRGSFSRRFWMVVSKLWS